MQRQSLGSPSSKLVKDESQSSSSSSLGEECQQQQQQQQEQLKKLNPKTPMPQSYIHLIPLLTLLCFLILYLSSHNPSLNGTLLPSSFNHHPIFFSFSNFLFASDLADFNSFNAISDPAESISELQGIMEIEKGDILAIRSLKNLKLQEAKHRRLHRKIPHF
ncbi:uncharacterized protein LOC121767608 isoform X1 [Salvia splendens]|uniref:uncharacterized protein LOC121767608 isoform X1 n=1 Tax=Salvia splendens TaxID=180675 RepID=UPI0011039A64|nr:uncharacterized protein LOC121767608 isoform X1 [Salvia splendens]